MRATTSHIETFFHVKKKKKYLQPLFINDAFNYGWNHYADRKTVYLGALKTLINTKWFQH